MSDCPICGRELIQGKSVNEHHLIPRSFKGTEAILLHKICHSKLHTVFSEREMLNHYHTIDRLLEHEEIQKFVKWVKNKDPKFYVKNKDTKERRSKRRK